MGEANFYYFTCLKCFVLALNEIVEVDKDCLF